MGCKKGKHDAFFKGLLHYGFVKYQTFMIHVGPESCAFIAQVDVNYLMLSWMPYKAPIFSLFSYYNNNNFSFLT